MTKKHPPSHLTHISDVLSQALSKYSPPQKTQITQIWEIWDSVLGAPIAQNAKPASFSNGLLQVIVSSSAWIHQLKFHEKQIIDSLNTGLGTPLITRLRFKIGEVLF